MTNNISAKQASAAIECIRIAYEMVASKGTDGMPSGHLYAHMMNALSHEQYESMLALMLRTKLLSRSSTCGDLLIAARV